MDWTAAVWTTLLPHRSIRKLGLPALPSALDIEIAWLHKPQGTARHSEFRLCGADSWLRLAKEAREQRTLAGPLAVRSWRPAEDGDWAARCLAALLHDDAEKVPRLQDGTSAAGHSGMDGADASASASAS